MDNRYTGEVAFCMGEESGILCFPMRAMAVLQDKYPDVNLLEASPEILAEIAEIGFQKKSPHIKKEKILDECPSIMQLVIALDKALLYAKHGVDEGAKILKKIEAARAAMQDVAEKKILTETK